jgi:hypothetical protein
VHPLRVVLAQSDAKPLASFTIDAKFDATNENTNVPFDVTCKVEETPGKGVIKFRAKLLSVRQPSIRGFCLDFVAGHCNFGDTALIRKQIVSSGLNNVTLHAALALPGRTFDSTTRIFINTTECHINEIDPTGRAINFRTPPLGEGANSIREGYQSIIVTNDATADTGAGKLCYGQDCARDRCNPASGSLCPTLPLELRGIFFTGVCIGTNRLGVEYPLSADPKCVALGDVASQHCSWGWGATCRNCPIGCRCPGGERCWVHAGYWIDGVKSTMDPIACEPAAEATARCLGYNLETGVNECGLDHDGFMCEGCRGGYYRSLGDCEKCPSTEVISAIVVPAVANGAVASAVFAVFVAVTFLIMRSVQMNENAVAQSGADKSSTKMIKIVALKDSLKESAWAAFSFTAYSIKTLQLIALSLQGAQNQVPPVFSTFIRYIGVVLLNLPDVHFECLGKEEIFSGDMPV